MQYNKLLFHHQVLRSIGYKSICIDPDIPFDKNQGIVPNTAGRVDGELGKCLCHKVTVTLELHLIWSTTGLNKRDLNGEVTILQGLTCTVESNLRLGKGDHSGEVTLLLR